jgi:rRNA maturation protein Nop10
MGKTYRECPACGKHALSIATRCPVCGEELLGQPVRREAVPPRGRPRAPFVVVGVVLVAAAVAAAALLYHRDTAPPETAASASAQDEASVAPDTFRVASASATTARPDSAPSAEAVPRVARTWTKVHEKRSVKADLSAVLLPGDTVLADSLEGGWWRVALEGKVIGYVHGGTLIGN